MKKLLAELSVNKKIHILFLSKNVAYIKLDDKYALVELVQGALGKRLEYHFMNRYDCDLIFIDYVKEVTLNRKAKLKFELLEM